MRAHQNLLYATEPGTRLALRGESIEVQLEEGAAQRVPRHHLSGVVCFGQVGLSPPLMHACAEEGISVVWLSTNGRFLARVEGPVSGNVLLRQAQYRAADGAAGLEIARSCVLGKLSNTRTLLRRGAREREEHRAALTRAADGVSECLPAARRAQTLEVLRGVEGQGAALAFSVFGLLLHGEQGLGFAQRTRRPPRDPANAALSFLYALLMSDCLSAAQSVRLDPQLGFLHQERPGRPSLALDLMEELRPVLADRALLSLINQRQLRAEHFETDPAGGVQLNAVGRKLVLSEWAARRRRELHHPVLDSVIPVSLLAQVQARILARHLRGDLDAYIPYIHPS